MTRPHTLARIEDIEWIVAHGGTFESVAARVGIDPRSVEKTLGKHGRRDLLEVLCQRRRDTTPSRKGVGQEHA